MPITVTGGRYSGNTTSVASATSIVNSAASFLVGDFNIPRIVGVWNAAGIYKGFAYVRRWVSATNLELEQAIFDADGNSVAQAVGDQYIVSNGFADIVTTGLSMAGRLATLTDGLILGTLGVSNSCCFYDENLSIDANVGSLLVLDFVGGLTVFGHIVSYAERTSYGGVNLLIRSLGRAGQGDQVTVRSLEVKLLWAGGSILSNTSPSRLAGSSAGGAGTPAEWQIWMGLYTNCDVISPAAGAAFTSNAANQRMINLVSSISGSNSICLRWGDGNIEGGQFKLIGANTLAVFGSDIIGSYSVGAPAGRFIFISDSGTAPKQGLWRSSGSFAQTVNYTNLITSNRRHGRDLSPGTVPNPLGTGIHRYSGIYTGLLSGTLAIVKGNSLLSAVIDSNTVGAGLTSTLTVEEARVTGHTETITENSWQVGFLRYGNNIISSVSTTQTISLGTAGNAKRVLLGGFVGQTIDADISVPTLATVLAYSTLATLDQMYDRAQAWKVESNANALYPTLGGQAVSSDGAALNAPGLNIRLDTAAAAAFAINTSTNLLTINPSGLAAGNKFSTLNIGAGRTLTLAQSSSYSALNLSTTATSVLFFVAGGTATIAGTFASGTVVNVTNGQTLTVIVPTAQVANLTAGTGVTIIAQVVINFTGIIAGSVIGVFNHLGTLVDSATVAGTTHSYSFSSPGLVTYTARVRRYGYAAFNTSILLSTSAIAIDVSQALDPFVTLSAAAAGALTGIAINYGTSLVTGSSDRTLSQYYDFARHSISLLANIGVVAAAIATSDGQNYALNFGLTLSGSSTITGAGSLGVGNRTLSLGAAQTYSFLASVGAAGRVSIASGETTIPNFTFTSGATIDNRAATAAIAYVLRTQIASITGASTGGGAIAVLAQKFTLAAPNFKDPTYPISVALIRQETFTITDVAISVAANTVTLTGHRLAIAAPGSFLAFIPVGGATLPTVAGGSIQALGLYFVRSVAGNAITLSQSIGGAELDFTSAGTGTFVVRAWTRVDAATVPGGSTTGYSYDLNDPAGTVFLLKARGHQAIALPATATKYQQSELSWGDANQTVSDTLNYTATPDSVYNLYTADTALPDDGSLITYLSVDLTNGNVQFDLGVGTSAIKRTEEIYQWFAWYTSTPAGLLYLGLVAGALNAANLFVDPPIQLQNVNDGTVLTLEGAFLRRSDGGQLVFADLSSGSIILAPSQLAVGYTLASGGGGGGLTGQQDTRLTEIHQVSTTPRLR